MTYVKFAGTERTTLVFVMEWLIVCVGVSGNILIIILIALYDGIKKTVNKILFINLAVADLGFLLLRHSFNFVELYYFPHSTLGAFSCKVLEPISMAFFPASLLTIITISYYRYQGIVQLGRSELSVKKASCIVGVIWTSTLTFYPMRRIPFSSKLNENSKTVCQLVLSKTIVKSVRLAEITMFFLVILVTFILFLKMRRTLIDSSKFNFTLSISLRICQNLKTLRVLKPVIIILFLTVTPISVADVLRLFHVESIKLILDFRDYMFMNHIFSVLMLINSSANPFIYAFASREFRTSFVKLLKLRCWRRKDRVAPTPDNS